MEAPEASAATQERRSSAARRLLGASEGNDALDRLAELAARLLRCASGQISLTTDASTVVGASGLPPGLDASRLEAPVTSLCEVSARERRTVRIPDTRADPLTGRRASTSPGAARAYLGVPLTTPQGLSVGTLCVFDPLPRTWTDQDVAALEALAASVVAELDRAALAREYGADRMRWEMAVDAAGIGSFDADLAAGRVHWDDGMHALMGTTPEEFDGTSDAFYSRVVIEDRSRVQAAVEDAIARRGSYAADCRVVLPGGHVRWVHARGRVLTGIDGKPEHLVGAVHDVTDEHEGEARVARALESMATAFFTVDRHGTLGYANAEAERLIGRPRAEVLGKPLALAFPAGGAPPFVGAFRDATTSGRPVVFEAPVTLNLQGAAAARGPLVAANGGSASTRWCEVRAWPSPDGLSVSLLDITARRAERHRAARGAERTTLLARVTAELAETLDGPKALARLARLVVPVLADWCVVALTDEAGRSSVGSWHPNQQVRSRLARSAPSRVAALSSGPAVRRALRAGQPMHLLSPDDESAPGPDLLTPSSTLVLPLRARDRSLGLLALMRSPGRGAADSDDVAIAQEIALRAALSLDNAGRYEAQRAVAEQLQLSMLTDPPQSEVVTTAVRYLPASTTAQVGGDWYDAFAQPSADPRQPHTVVVIGDVVGHDTAAAAGMGQLRALLRGIAHTTGAGPAEVLTRLDAAMEGLGLGTTATAAVLRLEHGGADPADAAGPAPAGGAGGATVLTWSNAGHPPPLLATPDGEVSVIDRVEPDLLLGIDAASRRAQGAVALLPGSTVLLYTDGLVERRDESISAGIARLRAELTRVAHLPLEELCDALVARMVPGGREDDVALLALRLPGGRQGGAPGGAADVGAAGGG